MRQKWPVVWKWGGSEDEMTTGGNEGEMNQKARQGKNEVTYIDVTEISGKV